MIFALPKNEKVEKVEKLSIVLYYLHVATFSK